MSEMVERVARAMYLSKYSTTVPDHWPKAEHYWPDRLDEIADMSADGYRSLARAAIEAMREPTDKMIVEAMIQPLPSVAEAGGVLEQGRAAARIEWQAMIDAALS